MAKHTRRTAPLGTDPNRPQTPGFDACRARSHGQSAAARRLAPCARRAARLLAMVRHSADGPPILCRCYAQYAIFTPGFGASYCNDNTLTVRLGQGRHSDSWQGIGGSYPGFCAVCASFWRTSFIILRCPVVPTAFFWCADEMLRTAHTDRYGDWAGCRETGFDAGSRGTWAVLPRMSAAHLKQLAGLSVHEVPTPGPFPSVGLRLRRVTVRVILLPVAGLSGSGAWKPLYSRWNVKPSNRALPVPTRGQTRQ